MYFILLNFFDHSPKVSRFILYRFLTIRNQFFSPTMSVLSSLYPPSPVDLPNGLTRMTSSYRMRSLLAVLAIILFFVLYFALVAGLLYLVYLAIMYPMMRVNRLTILGKLGAIAGSGMLFVFTLKFIFKLRNHRPEDRIKLSREDFPDLWDFVYRICDETGAPKPKAIFADPNVNAYVRYTNLWLSLIFPVRKELTIGLGLVGCVNLSEFKAVIAHEFGHFAQRSMKIGSYIVSANTIIHDMIYSHDRWDQMLEDWRRADIRLAFPAWIITPIIWVIRQVLALFYSFLNVMYSSLSREMEFNADQYAVTAAGSEAIVSALWKLNDGAATWNETLGHAYLASQKELFTGNLYSHNQLAMERIGEDLKNRFQALPVDDHGGKKFFATSENSQVGMYASHPPNDLREQSAKSPFVPCQMDERSPWELFGSNSDALQGDMTQLIYQLLLKKSPKEYISAGEFEAFIDTENKGNELFEHYHNTFSNRFLHIPSEPELDQVIISEPPAIQEQIEAHRNKVQGLMAPVQEIDTLLAKAQSIAQGTTKDKEIEFEGVIYGKKELEGAFTKILKRREELLEAPFQDWDTTFVALHLVAAKKLNRDAILRSRYRQHKSIVALYRITGQYRNGFISGFQQLQQQGEATEAQVDRFGTMVKDSMAELNKQMLQFGTEDFVPFGNISTPSELRDAVIPGGRFKPEIGNLFADGGFGRIMQDIEAATNHLHRIEQRSVAAILLLHKELLESL